MDLPDDAVVLRVLTGETDAYEILMRRYNRRLYRVARSIVRNAEEAEDVAQDTWVRAYAHLDQFASQALPEGYREVFVLREVEGMSSAETACCLGLTQENVRTRLHRAKAMLRDELYGRAGVVSSAAFQFLGVRCDRMVHDVLARVKAGL